MPVPPTPYFRLRLKALKFISAVDAGAQGPIADVALIKRAPDWSRFDGVARVVKTDEKLGLVFGWALATSLDGGETPHVDLQQDAIIGDDELIKIAAEFMEQGAASDVMHDDNPDGKIVFAMPLTRDVAGALGITTKVHGLAIAMRPSRETFRRFVSKELNAFSIAGTGVRELVKAAAAKCPSCDKYATADDKGNCQHCGKAMKRASRRPLAAHGGRVSALKAALSTADRDALPDSSFLYIEPGGSKDADGKTTPRSHRMFPYRDASGTVDIAHLRAAASDIPKSSLPKELQGKLQIRAEKLLAAQHDKAGKRLRKQAVLTSVVDGHQHQIDLDDPADEWRGEQLTTSYNTADGADQGHSHAWVYDEAGKITIALDSGHTHTIDAVVPADVIRQAQLNEAGERCGGCGAMCEEGVRFCPSCGAAMDRRDGVPSAASDDNDSSGTAVVVISARAPRAISTPSGATPTVKGENKEPTAMADPIELTALRAENALLKHMATLTDAARLHYERLVAKGVKSDVDSFLALTKAQRDVHLAEIAKSDAEVYTSKSTGKVYRMSDPVEIIEAAKQSDAMEATMKRLDTERAELEFTKAAGALIPNCLKGVKGNVPQRLIKAIRVEFKDPAELAEVEKAFKQYEAAWGDLTVAKGYNPNRDAEGARSPAEAWDTGLAKFAKDTGVANPLDAIVPFLKTDIGKGLKKALDAQRPQVGPS